MDLQNPWQICLAHIHDQIRSKYAGRKGGFFFSIVRFKSVNEHQPSVDKNKGGVICPFTHKAHVFWLPQHCVCGRVIKSPEHSSYLRVDPSLCGGGADYRAAANHGLCHP